MVGALTAARGGFDPVLTPELNYSSAADRFGDTYICSDAEISNDSPWDRGFVNVVTTGLGASVAGRVQRSTKRLGGSAAYLLGTLRELLSLRTDPATVRIDGRVVHEGPLALTLILNGRCCGGGMVPAPEAPS